MKNITCKFCGKKFTRHSHLLHCRCLGNLDYNSALLEQYESELNGKTIDDVIYDYSVNNFSLPDIYKKYGLTYDRTLKILNIKGVHIRSLKESALAITSPKHKKTCLEKYGVENISQLEETKEKKKNTFIEHYGVDNIWKTEDFKQFSRDRWNSYNEERKTELLRGFSERKHKFCKVSDLEKRVIDVMKLKGIDVEGQFKFSGYFHNYDIHVLETNILIEVNGDFWHGNPNLYDAEQILNFSEVKHVKVKDLWKRDQEHIDYATKKGFIVIVLWETDINNMNDNELAESIQYKINEIKKQ